MNWSIYFISLGKVKFHKLLTHLYFYDVIWRYNDNYASATTATSLIKLLFQKFIVYITGTTFLPNHVAFPQATTENKQVVGSTPSPQTLSVSKRTDQIGLVCPIRNLPECVAATKQAVRQGSSYNNTSWLAEKLFTVSGIQRGWWRR